MVSGDATRARGMVASAPDVLWVVIDDCRAVLGRSTAQRARASLFRVAGGRRVRFPYVIRGLADEIGLPTHVWTVTKRLLGQVPCQGTHTHHGHRWG